MAVLIDTDVVSFLYKDDDRGASYLPYLSNQLPIISFMTHNSADFESVPGLNLISEKGAY